MKRKGKEKPVQAEPVEEFVEPVQKEVVVLDEEKSDYCVGLVIVIFLVLFLPLAYLLAHLYVPPRSSLVDMSSLTPASASAMNAILKMSSGPLLFLAQGDPNSSGALRLLSSMAPPPCDKTVARGEAQWIARLQSCGTPLLALRDSELDPVDLDRLSGLADQTAPSVRWSNGERWDTPQLQGARIVVFTDLTGTRDGVLQKLKQAWPHRTVHRIRTVLQFRETS